MKNDTRQSPSVPMSTTGSPRWQSDGSELTWTPKQLAAIRADYDAWFAKRLVWRPIATAPKDGTEVLLYGPQGVDMGDWHTAYPDEIESGVVVSAGMPEGWHGFKGMWPGEPETQPTHWMPLPSAPTVDEGKATDARPTDSDQGKAVGSATKEGESK